ncbi:MAG: Nramp family divalent metal transporter [Saprospiraceae bacterium]|nr:Nramp family divalent metal transporter [Saprospiraceae bacterium]
MKKYFGPSTLVTAAFIGPGTITTCTMAGVQASYSLLWVMLFAVVATIILQEMSARLGWATQQGLGEALSAQFTQGIARYLVFFLVIGAILVGNAAYEAGNISGGVLGLELTIGPHQLWPVAIGALCFALLYWGKYKLIEKTLVLLVILMSISFLITVVMVQPDWTSILRGFVPFNGGGSDVFLILALIGTTVVPYNLFLHASTISKKWKPTHPLRELRTENAVAIILGGIISMLIIITSAASAGAITEVNSAKDLAIQLEPLFGQQARVFMGIGLMAAGVSSALTAPLAAAYAAKGIFGWSDDESKLGFRSIWMFIVLAGILVSITNIERVLIIKFAQVTNALVLPFIAGYLLYICNSKKIMDRHTNSTLANILGVAVVCATLALSIRSLGLVFGWF